MQLPLDFERRESLRLFGRKLVEADSAFDSVGFVLATALRIWLDFAQAAAEFRPLRNRAQNSTIDWATEDLTYVIEDSAKWAGNPGQLMVAAVDSGFIKIEHRAHGSEEQVGIVLDGFWPLNEHLSPDFESIQKRGGKARQASRIREESERAAQDRNKIFEQQENFHFGNIETTPAEREKAYGLFIRLHRVCGLDAPLGEQFEERAMVDALFIIRKFSDDQIAQLEEWLLSQRDNPEIVKMPARILEHIGKYMEQAKIV